MELSAASCESITPPTRRDEANIILAPELERFSLAQKFA
jgi:hypothetical protein